MGKELENGLRKMFMRGKVVDADVPHIDALFNIVISKHFRGRKDREELLAECRLSVITLVEKRQYDPSKSALNYGYTRVRNHITNILAKKTPSTFTDSGIEDVEEEFSSVPSLPYRPQDILRDVDSIIEYFGIEGSLVDFVKKYFADKLGMDHKSPACYCSLEFYRRYLFYVRIIEWVLVQKHSSLTVVSNGITEVIPHLGLSDSQTEMLNALSKVVNEDTMVMLLYVFSGQSLKMPSHNKLLKTDRNLSIFKDHERNNSPARNLASKHSRSVSSVQSVLARFKS